MCWTPSQPAELPWGSQAHWKAEWKINSLKKVYETDQYVVGNSGLTGQGKHKTGPCQAWSKEKIIKEKCKTCAMSSAIPINLPWFINSTPCFLSPSLLFSSSFLPVLLHSFNFLNEYALDELLKCLLMSQSHSRLLCWTLLPSLLGAASVHACWLLRS